MRKLSFLSVAVAMVAGCAGASDGGSRSGADDLEAHCRAWCDPETGCSDSTGTAKQCLDSCMASAEQDPCFDHVVTYQECLLAMECTDPFEDCEAPQGIANPRGGGAPVCETIENPYARCTCENLYDGGTGGTGGTGTSWTPDTLCDEVCGWPDACFVELGVPIAGDCLLDCQASVDSVGIACLGAIADTVACLGTCDVNDLTEQQILACQDEAQRISDSCE